MQQLVCVNRIKMSGNVPAAFSMFRGNMYITLIAFLF